MEKLEFLFTKVFTEHECKKGKSLALLAYFPYVKNNKKHIIFLLKEFSFIDKREPQYFYKIYDIKHDCLINEMNLIKNLPDVTKFIEKCKIYIEGANNETELFTSDFENMIAKFLLGENIEQDYLSLLNIYRNFLGENLFELHVYFCKNIVERVKA